MRNDDWQLPEHPLYPPRRDLERAPQRNRVVDPASPPPDVPDINRDSVIFPRECDLCGEFSCEAPIEVVADRMIWQHLKEKHPSFALVAKLLMEGRRWE